MEVPESGMKAAVGASMLAVLLLACPAGAQKPELVVGTGHTFAVSSVVFSPDGRTLASGSGDKTVKLWDVASGRELRTVVANTSLILSLAFRPDGRVLAVGDWGGTIKFFDVESGRELLSISTGSQTTSSLAFSPDGRVLASGSGLGHIRFWDVATGRSLQGIDETGASSLAFSPDGRTLASSGESGIELWDVATRHELRCLESYSSLPFVRVRVAPIGKKSAPCNPQETTDSQRVYSVTFSPDGKTLASGGEDKIIKLWDVATGRKLKRLTGHTGEVRAVAFSPDGRMLASGGIDKTIKLWNVDSGQELRSLAGHPDGARSVAFSPDGRTLASGGMDKSVTFWDVETGHELRSLASDTVPFESVAFSPDGRKLASGNGSMVKVWDVSSGHDLTSLGTLSYEFPASSMGRVFIPTAIAFSPDGRSLASVTDDRTIKMWDLTSGRELPSVAGSAAQVYAVAYTSDGRVLALGNDDSSEKLWDMASGGGMRMLADYKMFATAVAFNADAKILALGGKDKTIKLYDVAAGREIGTLAGYTRDITAIAFSPDRKTLASGSDDNTIRIWDLASSRQLHTLLTSKTEEILAVALSPDGQTAASAGGHEVTLWEVTTGRKLHILASHSDFVTALAFSPDGKCIASTSLDGTVRIWNSASGELLATLISFSGGSDWVVVTPDGLFDGSPEAWNHILWRFNNNTFDVAPVEIFFREFYYPGLLADILAGKHPKATTDIANVDRRQPVVAVERANGAAPGQPMESRTVKLRLRAGDAPPDAQHKDRSGARDLRLFRNGALVKVWRGDLELDAQGQTVLEAELPIVAGENKFTAYAYSKSDIKSPDATIDVTGADALKRGGVAYILAIGVNEYADKDYNLKYATADAGEFASVFSAQQLKLQNYAAVQITSLLNQDATKANLLGALDRLAGASADRFTPAQQKLFASLAPAQPEDGVFIYYAGHGFAVGQRFYLLPHDIVMPERSEDFAKPEAHAVSDLELGDRFEKIGAGRSLFVIDACRSGQALEAEEKRRGPMNSKGLAQLAYEKGMYILTAAQGYQSALESAALGGGHGFLTYALVERGLKTQDAAVDGQVELRHWLDFATQLVPQLQLALMQQAQSQGRGIAIVDGEDKEIASPEQRSLQRPRVFYRREPEAQPFIVAKP
jgi:WD40 repeat protein